MAFALRKQGFDLQPTGKQSKRMKDGAVCLAEGCASASRANGYCGMHNMRVKRYGSPEIKKSLRCEPPKWIDAHVGYTGDECLEWPFRRDGQGRGVISIARRHRVASHIMCSRVHGPAPEGQPFAVHSCGNGHAGCVNTRHLRWASHAENMQDMVNHGTSKRGNEKPNAVLSEALVRWIRDARLRGLSMREIGITAGCSTSTVQKVLERRSWGWVE